MTSFWWNLVEVNVALVVLWFAFKWIQRYLSFGQQRVSLLLLPALAVLVLVIKNALINEGLTYSVPMVELEEVVVQSNSNTTVITMENGITVQQIYWWMVMLFAVWIGWRIVRILVLFRSSKPLKIDGYTIVELPEKDSFSFFNWIQIRSGLAAEEREIILQHEMIHARKGHTFDLLYMEAVHCFSWFNPLMPLIKKDLVHIHEFEVDQLMYNKYNVHYMEFLLAYSLGTSSSSYLLTNQFLTKLTLIKRIKIMKHTTKKRWALALVLPLVAGSMTLVSWTAQQPTSSVKKVTVPAQVVEDVDKQAEFKGGMDALIKYLSTNIKYPESAKKEKVTGTVYVSFVVTETGKISNVEVKKGVNSDLDTEAKRVVTSMPDWIPGEKDGKKVSTEMMLPIAFQL